MQPDSGNIFSYMHLGQLFIFLTLLTIYTNLVYAQKEYHNWYFGDKAGLTFNSDAPGILGTGKMYAWEGSASISDKEGNLLFYTNGREIYNKNHIIMEDGLTGGWSATQAALIVPLPNSDSLYYLFCIPDESNSIGHLTYSIINITLNGGLGGVTAKNIMLLDSVGGEKITIAKHCNQTDFWVIAHGLNNNLFYSWHLDPSGIVDTVITAVGSIHEFGYGLATSLGYMKVSPNNKMIALAVQGNPAIPPSASGGYLEVLKFDNLTGLISEPKLIPNVLNPYGIEFSPDHSKLYAGSANGGVKKMYQYNLLNNVGMELTAAQIKSSEYIKNVTGSIGALKLGPDKKIYVVDGFGSSSLGIIEDPNNIGLDSYIKGAVSISPGGTLLGLPNYTSNHYIESRFTVSDSQVCEGTPIYFYDKSSNYPEHYLWDFGDGNTSDLKNPIHSYSDKGSYYVTLTTSSYCEPIDTFGMFIQVTEELSVVAYGDTTINKGDLAQIGVSTSATNISWNHNESLSCSDCLYPKAKPEKTTTYYVSVNNDLGCSGSDSVIVYVLSGCEAFIPSAFSPNSDHINDELCIANIDEGSYKVYDRLGSLVFESDEMNKICWDGKNYFSQILSGNYTYIFHNKACGIIKGNISIIN